MKIPDILDNTKPKVFEVLNYFLKTQEKSAFASGFFNIGGYQLVKNEIGKAAEFRLLLGKEPEIAEPKPEVLDVQKFFNESIRQHIEIEEFTKENKDTVDELIDFLSQDKVKVKIYPHNFFHGKAYIFEDFAIVGSSNFTSAGLVGNTELNYVVKQSASVKELKEWFDRFWKDSVDYKDEMIARYNESKFGRKEYTPYQIYMKTLYEYFREDFEDEEKDYTKLSEVELTEFQEDAYNRAKRIIKKYNGVVIADTVGLGKTFIGKKLLEDYAYHLREDALLVIPAQLRKMWEDELQKAHIKAVIKSMEEISREEFPIEEFAKFKFVLVDESHNFRNRNDRYSNLFKLIGAGEKKKVVLLTATPISNTLWDLYNQISLISRGDDHYFRRTGIYDLKRYFLQAMDADVPSDNLFNLLEEICVRRPRQSIKKNYPNATVNGQPVKFPERELVTQTYNLEEIYEGIYDEIVKDINDELYLTPYNISEYLKKKTKEVEEEIERSKALSGIMRTLFLKRFESSIDAFRKSIKYQLEYLGAFSQYFNKGELLNAQFFRQFMLDDEGETKLDMARGVTKIDLNEYKVNKVNEHIEEDKKILTGILNRVNECVIPPAKDGKLQKFKEVIRQLGKQKVHTQLGEQKKKVLVFSYYKDTIDYISKEILNDKEIKDLFKDRRIEVITGETPTPKRNEIISAFAPRIHEREDIADTPEEVQLLFSTDILSEGQNLQSCDTLINYDLHWNPTRMIQRSGRIDRLLSPFDIIYIHNFFPEEGLENLLHIVEALTRKISTISKTIGLDVSILGEKVNPKTFNALRRIKVGDKTIIEELEAENELVTNEVFRQELINFLTHTSKTELHDIPLGVHSGLTKPHVKGVFFYIKAKDYQYLEYYNLNKKEIVDNRLDIFRIISCNPDTPREVAKYDIYKMLKEVIEDVLKKAEEAIGVETAPKKLDKAQRDLRDVLDANFDSIDDKEKASLVYAILSSPLKPYIKDLAKIRDDYIKTKDFASLFSTLLKMIRRYKLDVGHQEQSGQNITPITKKDLKLICFDVLS